MTPEDNETYHHGDLRRALIEAATNQLATKPAHQLSLRELARIAGVSRTAPYHHFEDKTALLQAVATEAQTRFYQAQLTAAKQPGTPTERLIGVGEAYVTFALDSPNAFALVFDPDYCPGAEGSTAPESPAMTALAGLLHSIVVEGQQDGTIPGTTPDPHIAALWGLVHGLSALVTSGFIPREAVRAALGAFVQETPTTA